MGKRLSSDERIASIQAVQEYISEYSKNEVMLVIVKQGNNVLCKDRIYISISDETNYYTVNVMWEDIGYDYHADGLRGYFSTDFCKMRYTKGVLTIYFDGNIEITITQ